MVNDFGYNQAFRIHKLQIPQKYSSKIWTPASPDLFSEIMALLMVLAYIPDFVGVASR